MAIFRLDTKLDEKTIYNMVHEIYKCVRGDEISFTKIWRACGITQIHDSFGVYMYSVLAGGALGVGLLVCCIVSAVSIGGGGGGAEVCLGVRVDVIRWPIVCCRPRM